MSTFTAPHYIIAEDEAWKLERVPGTRVCVTYGSNPYATVRYPSGHRFTVPLNVPLCACCDAPLLDDGCSDCETGIYDLGLAPVVRISPTGIAA